MMFERFRAWARRDKPQQDDGVPKAYITDKQTLKDVTPTIPAAMYGLPVPNGAGRPA